MQQNHKQRRVDDVRQQLGRILAELALIGPPEVVSVVLALPTALAHDLEQLARLWGADVTSLHLSMLVHGAYHTAAESNDQENRRRSAGLIRLICTDQEWERFCAQHPEARDG